LNAIENDMKKCELHQADTSLRATCNKNVALTFAMKQNEWQKQLLSTENQNEWQKQLLSSEKPVHVPRNGHNKTLHLQTREKLRNVSHGSHTCTIHHGTTCTLHHDFTNTVVIHIVLNFRATSLVHYTNRN